MIVSRWVDFYLWLKSQRPDTTNHSTAFIRCIEELSRAEEVKEKYIMTCSYIEGEQFLGQGPNISGMSFLIKAVEDAGGKHIYPNIDELLETGEANAMAIKGEAERMLKKTKEANVRNMLQLLARAAAKANKVITISH